MVEPGESAAIINSIVPPAERAHEGRMHVSVGDGSTAELQDLAVLRQMLIDDPERFGDPSDQEVLLALIDRRRAELTQQAVLLGQRFFQDRPREFAGHLKGYWKSWHDPIEPPLKV